MTERIYQLRESEYNELFEKAKLNDKEVKEHAEEAARRVKETLRKYHEEIGE